MLKFQVKDIVKIVSSYVQKLECNMFVVELCICGTIFVFASGFLISL